MSNLSQDQVNAVLKEGIKNTVVWCANGTLCEVPNGKMLSNVVVKEQIKLTGAIQKPADEKRPAIYHKDGVGLGLHSDWEMSFDVNGSGGTRRAMDIGSNGNVYVKGDLYVDGAIRLKNGWRVQEYGNKIYIGKDKGIDVMDSGDIHSGFKGWLVGEGKTYRFRSLRDQCLDSGSSGNGCDDNNNHRVFKIEYSNRN